MVRPFNKMEQSLFNHLNRIRIQPARFVTNTYFAGLGNFKERALKEIKMRKPVPSDTWVGIDET